MVKRYSIRRPTSRVPSEYQEVPYIEGHGAEWIDTGIIANGGCVIEAIGKAAEDYGFWVGSIGRSADSPDLTRNAVGGSTSGALIGNYSFQKLDDYRSVTPIDGNMHKFYLDTTGTKLIGKVDGVEIVNHANVGTLSNLKTTIKISYSDYSSAIRKGVYGEIKIWNSQQTLVRDFIPVRKKSNSEYGMYDLVSKAFFDNDGTGAFTGGLPFYEEFEEVEYIQSSGAQYIDTGFMPNQDTRVDMDIEIYDLSKPVLAIFDAKTAWDNKAFTIGSWSSSGSETTAPKVAIGYANYGATPPSADAVEYTIGRHIISANKNVFAVGNLYSHTFTKTNFTCADTLKFNYSANPQNNNGLRIYNAKIWVDGTTLSRDYIPVRKKSNSEYGLYDTVTKQFFGNDGTGSFTGGTAVPLKTQRYVVERPIFRVPSEYQEVEYVRGVVGAYLDTGLKVNNNTKIECSIRLNIEDAAYGIFGVRTSAQVKTFTLFNATNLDVGSGKALRKDYGLATTITRNYADQPTVTNHWYDIVFNGAAWTVDGRTQLPSPDLEAFTTEYNLWLFNVNTAGETLATQSDGLDYRACKIWVDGTTLSRDYIPVKRKSDNAYGLYDLVTKQFFGNQGTGAFTGGNPVVEIRRYIIEEAVA